MQIMRNSRREFIKVGGLTIIAGGIIPAFLNPCTGEKKPSEENSAFENMVKNTGAIANPGSFNSH